MKKHRLAAPLLCALAGLAAVAALDAHAQSPGAAPTNPPAPVAVKVAPPAPAAPAGPPSVLDVYVMGQGTPIPGVRVVLAADNGRSPEMWNAGDQPPISTQTTDADGRAHFDNVPPGRYVATTGCEIPGNWIAGNYASRVEAFAGRPLRVTLTMRQGGMIRGKVLRGDRPAGLFDVKGEAADALASTCSMMSVGLVDTATGAFTMRKVPLGATSWVKVQQDAGDGRLSVWHSYTMARPETVDAQFALPSLDPKGLGTLVIRFRPDSTAPLDSGTTTLTLVQPDGSWRYEVQTDIGSGRDSVATLRNLPAGGYQVLSRPYPAPGKNWWSAPIDSVRVTAGKTSQYLLRARVSR